MMNLNAQFTLMATELQAVNHELQNKVAELDVLATYLKRILDHIVQGILFIDIDGTVTTYNAAAEKILGVKQSEVLFQRFWLHFPDDVFGFSMQQSLKNYHTEDTRLVAYTTVDGVTRQLSIVMTSMLVAAQAVEEPQTQGLIVMISDVTEVYHLQTLAARADRMKELGEMAAHVAHQIRNPLGGIKGYASLLKRDLKAQPELQQMAAYVVEGTENLDHLVNQILQYARPVQIHLERVNIKELLVELRHHVLADAHLTKGKISIDIQVEEDVILLLDPSLCKSALLNLFVNAIQAMPEGGAIKVSVHKRHKWVQVAVSDSGEGISKENLKQLFSPFFTTKPQGNGLGLTEVQKVVQAHGGTVNVTSTVGQGTTFSLEFPLN